VQLDGGSGYIFGTSGRLRLDRRAATVASFVTTVPCAGQISVRSMPIDAFRHFAYRGRVRTRRGTRVSVAISGRFVDSAHVRGVLRAESRVCRARDVVFVARLS
jgi:hypothetical protein